MSLIFRSLTCDRHTNSHLSSGRVTVLSVVFALSFCNYSSAKLAILFWVSERRIETLGGYCFGIIAGAILLCWINAPFVLLGGIWINISCWESCWEVLLDKWIALGIWPPRGSCNHGPNRPQHVSQKSKIRKNEKAN